MLKMVLDKEQKAWYAVVLNLAGLGDLSLAHFAKCFSPPIRPTVLRATLSLPDTKMGLGARHDMVAFLGSLCEELLSRLVTHLERVAQVRHHSRS
jgi:hypothetical protein